MFTGLIQHVGTIRARIGGTESTRFEIDAEGWSHQPEPGASIAVNGCCLTVVSADGCLAFDMVPITLERTTLGGLDIGSKVNLEHAATPETLLGGHIVQGHVDGIGTVESNGSDGSDGWKLVIRPSGRVTGYLVEKGSIAIEGVSLTIAGCSGGLLEVALIPETLSRTTLGSLEAGDQVNLEADCLAKMVGALLEQRGLISPGDDPES
ncbi:MAG: riboflavin synthase [Phycisphaerales bacterium]|nr:riboflavin synthase [Phycisphaerales bacterium]